MTELAVSNMEVSLKWYRDILGLRVQLIDEANQFALFTSTGGRLAIKQGKPNPGNVIVHFGVDDFDAMKQKFQVNGVTPLGEEKSSPEGYRRLLYPDPDGYTICIFQMLEVMQ